jgi:TolC family type I secretion outer membrane protein
MGEQNKNRTKREVGICIGVLLAAVLTMSGCASELPRIWKTPGTSVSAAVPWVPPPEAVPDSTHTTPPMTLPEDILKSGRSLSLLDIVDIALRNNPETAAAWAESRSAAAAYGSQKGTYYPQVGATAGTSYLHRYTDNGENSYSERNALAALELDWLIFDFGRREASLNEVREALIAADWSHNAVIQKVILEVEKAYYGYVTAKVLIDAQEATYKEAQTNLAAAKDRHHAGVATIADVLQAKTALAQAKLVLDSLQGQVQTTRGALATAMGLAANTPYDIGIPAGEIPLKETLEQVDAYLAQAEKQRPDLAAARAQARKAGAHVRKVEAEAYPSINGTGGWGKTYYGKTELYKDNYSGALQLSVPIFTGFSQRYNEQQARADEETARARLNSLEQQVVLEVWTSYYNLKTAEQRVRTSEDLLESATESYQVALGRYKAGVGSILDLLSAQSALEGARAQRVQAKSDWFVSLAQLAYDTGTLNISSSGTLERVPITMEKVEKP